MKLRPPAVKVRAEEMGLTVYQPVKVRDGSLANWMRQRDADLALVIAYGRILTTETLGAPRLGCVNLHASLLPEYRGAAPIQRAVMDGCEETGVCLMQMDEGMDTGDVLAVRKIPILDEDTAGSLAIRLGALAAEITRTELPRLMRGELRPTAQDESRATHAPPLTSEDVVVDFTQPAERIHNRVRGLAPRPGARTQLVSADGKRKLFKILQTKMTHEPVLLPGLLEFSHGQLLVGTGSTPLEIVSAQPEGKRAQSAQDLHNGRVVGDGDRLET
jgi:methionyl-tRNA formyltransferase